MLATTDAAFGAGTRIGGLSVSPDNTKIALAGFDTGKVLIYDYAAGNGLGSGTPALTNLRQSSTAILGTGADYGVGGQQGTTWVNNHTVLAFSGDGKLYEVDATSMASTLKQQLPVVVLPQMSTALAYNPSVSPYVYAVRSSFYIEANNTLYVLDPANNYRDLTGGGIDFSVSASAIRDIALDENQNLILVTNASVGRLEYIPDVVSNPAAIAPNASVDFYNDEVILIQPAFPGLDVGFAAVPEPSCVASVALFIATVILRRRTV